METKRIIRLLIIIFAFLTLFFGYLYIREYKNKNTLSEDFLKLAVENLELNGIKVEENALLREVPDKNLYVFSRSDENSYYENITKNVIDALYGSNVMSAFFDVPDGAAFGLYEKNDFDRELGRIVFSALDMSFVFTKNLVNVNGGEEIIYSGDVSVLDDEIVNKIETLAQSLNNKGNMSYRISGVSGEDELFVVSVLQTVDGCDINNCYMNFVCNADGIVKLYGKWIPEEPKAMYHEVLCDGVNALYKLNINNVTKVLSENVVYAMRRLEEEKYYLLPVWEIEYIDSESNVVREYVEAI